MSANEVALGKRLQMARKRSGLTQQELCQKTGLSYSTLAKIERGAIRSPSVFTVSSIAKATGVGLEDLLGINPSGALDLTKKVSKTGVKFVYFDVSGTLINFSSKFFADIAKDAHLAIDRVESVFWRYNADINRGKMSLEQFDRELAKQYGLPFFDFQKRFFAATSRLPQGWRLFEWVSQHYEAGLLTNHVFIDQLQKRGLIPSQGLTTIVDSSKVGAIKPETKIYQIAQKRAGVAAHEILFVDNERPYLIAADRLGWQIAWFDDSHPAESYERIKKLLEF